MEFMEQINSTRLLALLFLLLMVAESALFYIIMLKR